MGSPAAGAWKYTSSSTLESATDAGGELRQTFRGEPNLIAYSVSAVVQATFAGGTYGLYPAYRDPENYVAAFLDADAQTFVSTAMVDSVDLGRSEHPLPPDFDFTARHTVRVDKSGDGEFTVFLDGLQVDSRTVEIEPGQIGIFTSAAATWFGSVSISDGSHGWGDASGDAAQGFARDGDGYVHGPWKIRDAANAASTGLGGGLHEIYQGNPNLSSFAVSATAVLQQVGSSAEHPGYGLYACYDDRSNQASFWVRPGDGSVELKTIVQGRFATVTAPLPEAFDPSQAHTLASEKNGTSFVFYLDGVEVFRQTIPLANGMGGLVTEDAAVDFRNFTRRAL
jgi:hypothetical protein